MRDRDGRISPPAKMKRVFEGELEALKKVPKGKRGPLGAAVTMRLSHLFSRWIERNLNAEWTGSGPQMMLLAILGRHKSLTMGEAAELLDVTPRAITRLVDGLEKEDLVTRQVSPHDKRVYIISISPKAEVLTSQMMPKHEKLLSELFSVLTEEELFEYIKISTKLAAHIKEDLRKKN